MNDIIVIFKVLMLDLYKYQVNERNWWHKDCIVVILSGIAAKLPKANRGLIFYRSVDAFRCPEFVKTKILKKLRKLVDILNYHLGLERANSRCIHQRLLILQTEPHINDHIASVDHLSEIPVMHVQPVFLAPQLLIVTVNFSVAVILDKTILKTFSEKNKWQREKLCNIHCNYEYLNTLIFIQNLQCQMSTKVESAELCYKFCSWWICVCA